MDGTLVPIKSHNVLPSARVITALQQASKKIKIGVITGRPYWFMEYICDMLSLSAPCVVASGAKIIDPKDKRILATQILLRSDVIFLIDLLRAEGLHANIDFHDKKIPLASLQQLPDEPVDAIFIADHLTATELEPILAKILARPTLSAHKMPTPEKGKFGVSINHVSATKQHGILQVAQLLGIKTDEIIGVGDGHNDMPLLLSCGLGVAMGNAPDELKAIADYVAPSFSEDGVAEVIEKFILN